jgi:hypothetical protein
VLLWRAGDDQESDDDSTLPTLIAVVDASAMAAVRFGGLGQIQDRGRACRAGTARAAVDGRLPGGSDLRLVRLSADDDLPLQLLAAFRARPPLSRSAAGHAGHPVVSVGRSSES